MARFLLSDALTMHGYTMLVRKNPGLLKDVLGKPEGTADAAALPGNVIAVREDDWQYAYAAAHEIAEDIEGHQHTATMFCTQANILFDWCKEWQIAQKSKKRVHKPPRMFWCV